MGKRSFSHALSEKTSITAAFPADKGTVGGSRDHFMYILDVIVVKFEELRLYVSSERML